MPSRSRVLRLLCAFSLLPVSLVAVATHADATPTTTCQEVRVPVTIPIAGNQEVAGSLCWQGATAPSAIQVLVPGITYNRLYWDFDYQPATYSYVRSAVAAGYATLAIDRLGTGNSTKPLGATLNNLSQSSATHQVISALRAGQVAGQSFTKVVLVGHSYGAAVTWYEAAGYHDVDAVIIVGLEHKLAVAGIPIIASSFWPAILDPKFMGTVTDPTSVTTRPGTRKPFFYGPNGDPAVIAHDEATKDIAAATELGSEDALLTGMSSHITVPVLIGMGERDIGYCGLGGGNCSSSATVLADETPYYSSAPCVEAYVSPDAGHDTNLDPTAPAWFAAANAWVGRALAPGVSSPTAC